MRKKLTLGIIAAFVVLNVAIAVVVIFVTRDRDLSIPDTAIAFQEAVYGGNYEAMWDMSAPEYRNGLSRDRFIENARRSNPPFARIDNWTVKNGQPEETVIVHTLLQLSSGEEPMHRILLRVIDGEWRVSEYEPYSGDWPPPEVRRLETLTASE